MRLDDKKWEKKQHKKIKAEKTKRSENKNKNKIYYMIEEEVENEVCFYK